MTYQNFVRRGLLRHAAAAGVLAWLAASTLGTGARAQAAPYSQAFLPPSGKGPVVLVLSGQTGPQPRQAFAREVAALGYYTVLLDGNDVLNRSGNGQRVLTDALAAALASPHAASTKAAVIGFSLGGGGLLGYATHRSDTVSMAVAYYPATSWIPDVPALAGRIKVPLLVYAAEKDSYKNCCPLDRARQLEEAARQKGAGMELVVCPDAEHGFDLPGRHYRQDLVDETWRRTQEMLARLHPVAR